MSDRFRPLMIIGTRPEAIKMAPIIHRCRSNGRQFEPIICFTGQHRDMLQQITEYFEIVPEFDLDLMRPNQSLSALTARCVEGLDRAIARFRPDALVAQGDTTTVMASSMVSFFHRLPFVHVEAGLRTGNLQSPWPEEYNRRVAALATSIHCAPTRGAAENLKAEGIDPQTIHVTGNTVIDALLWTLDRELERDDFWRSEFSMLQAPRLVLITAHRRENFGSQFESICRAIDSLAARFPDVDFVYPVHPNPNVTRVVHRFLADGPNIHLIRPQSYPAFVWLMHRAELILTDSGGVQEEAPSLRKPVVVMRDTTERPEAVEAGAVQLVGTAEPAIVSAVTNLLNDPAEYERRQLDTSPYGDGQAAQRIADLLLTLTGQEQHQIRRAA